MSIPLQAVRLWCMDFVPAPFFFFNPCCAGFVFPCPNIPPSPRGGKQVLPPMLILCGVSFFLIVCDWWRWYISNGISWDPGGFSTYCVGREGGDVMTLSWLCIHIACRSLWRGVAWKPGGRWLQSIPRDGTQWGRWRGWVAMDMLLAGSWKPVWSGDLLS